MGFWTLLAEKIAITPDGEPDLDRGHRLEPEALKILAQGLGEDIDLDPGMWVSDDTDDIAISPDGAQIAYEPEWAAEAKCLNSANHLRYVIKDRQARRKEFYKPINSIPNEKSCAFREQVVQYFVVNEKLQTLYFVLFDDRIAINTLTHHIITIKRSDIADEIAKQRQQQLDVLAEIEQLIKELPED
jgi:hypothetical protein